MATEDEPKGPCPANDNGSHGGEPLDPRIRRIAEAIGRQLAYSRDGDQVFQAMVITDSRGW